MNLCDDLHVTKDAQAVRGTSLLHEWAPPSADGSRPPIPTLDEALGYARWRRQVMERMQASDQVAVLVLRHRGLSWERISVAFGGSPTAQTLRRLYGQADRDRG